MGCLHQVAANPEEIIDRAMHREKTLDVAGRFEAPHLAFALAGRLVGDFGAIVCILRGAVLDGAEGSPMSRSIAP